MLLAVVFAHVWGVVQLVFLGSLARTVRVRTVFSAMAVGFFACTPLGVLLQVTWIRIAASLTGVHGMEHIASYTVDPFMEEILKILPLALLLWIPTIRRQWSITDCVLIGAATGSGVGLAEALFRVGGRLSDANPIDDGWMLGISLALPVVPSIGRSLVAWLPSSLFDSNLVLPGATAINLHLAWAAIGGLAVGLVVRLRGSIRWVVAGALLLFVSLDHVAVNAAVNAVDGRFVAMMGRLRQFLGLLPLAAIVVAWWLDRQYRQRAGGAGSLEPRLARERSMRPRLRGLWSAATIRLPWSLFRVLDFVRLRRAYANARVDSHDGANASAAPLAAIVTNLRNHIDRIDRIDDIDRINRVDRDGVVNNGPQNPSMSSAARAWSFDSTVGGALTAWLRQRVNVLWLVLLMPSFLRFVAGGWPQTVGIQRVMTSAIVWPFLVLLSTVTQAWVVWRLIVLLCRWRRIIALPLGDQVAFVSLRMLCGFGALGLGGYALTRAITGASPGTRLLTLHESEAFEASQVELALIAADGGAYTLPPGEDVGRRGSEQEDLFSFDPSIGGGQSVQAPPEKTPPRQPSDPDPRHAGYEAGRTHGMPQDVVGASSEYQAAYDQAYRAGVSDRQAADSATTAQGEYRESPPEEWLERRVIPTLSDDGVGANNVEYTGTKDQLDAIQDREFRRIATAQLEGLLHAGAKFNPHVPRSPMDRGTSWPAGGRGESVSPDDD